jgi:hypothetical protein
MKTYQFELQRTSYVTVTLEATNRDHAEALAWQKLERNQVDIEDSNWDLILIEEIDA